MSVAESEFGFRYWAFISYSHQDQAWGRWLQRALETYRMPRRLIGQPIAAGVIPPRLTPVFRDRDELPTATDLGSTVAEALRQSWCLIVVCSPAAAESRWVNEEVREFQRLGRGRRIHCLLIGAKHTAAPCFPPALLDQSWSGHAAGEPIAADARRGGDGKTHARLKLVAGILGISFDKLVQRDHQRGYRRMVAIATTALLALVVLTTFTFVTITSRRDAEAQRAHAEGLVEFMLGDLRSRLAPEGELATLDAVGKEALSYYAAQDPARLDADALARRARALHLIGEVYDQRGRLDDALGVFREAATTTAELLSRDKGNPQRLFDHAQSLYGVGLVALQRGQVGAAETAFRGYLDLATRLVAHQADKVEWQAELEYANSNLGTLLLGLGRVDEAAALFERALAISEDLSHRAPNDSNRRIELAQSHAWVADARVDQGRLQEAMAQREVEVSIYEGILALDPRNREVQDGLMVAERELGNLSLMRGDVALAVRQLERAVALSDALLLPEAGDTTIIAHAATTHAVLAEAVLHAGKTADAQASLRKARELAAQLVGRDPSVVAWQALLGHCMLLQARLDPDPLSALRSIQGVLQRLDALRGPIALERGARLAYADGLFEAGVRDAALGNPTQARVEWSKAVTEIRAGAPLTGPSAEAVLALALRHLGRDEEAAPVIARLERIGYLEPRYATAIVQPKQQSGKDLPVALGKE